MQIWLSCFELEENFNIWAWESLANSLTSSCLRTRKLLMGPQAKILVVDGDVAQLVEHRTSTPLRQVRFPGAARDFSPRISFQCRLCYGVLTPRCAIACINIFMHVKDPVVHVRVHRIMEKLKHPACTIGWVASLCGGRLSQGKATRISHGRNPSVTIQLWKKKLDWTCRKCVNISAYRLHMF